MSGLYITEVNIKKTNEYETSEDFGNQKDLDINSGKSAFLVKNTKEFEETTSKILNYMVGEQTDFADLMKIEEFLKSQTIKYCEELNLNKHDIQKKTDFLKKITSEIEEVNNLFEINYRNFSANFNMI